MDLNLNEFSSITLDKMNKIRLMKRIDRKYLLPLSDLPIFLENLKDSYFMQEIDGNRCSQYSTLYYDTPDYMMYRSHQNGKLSRIKIRTREYVDSNLCFLEIKTKSNKGVTQKIRIANETLHSIGTNECRLSTRRRAILLWSVFQCSPPNRTYTFQRIRLSTKVSVFFSNISQFVATRT